MNIKNNSLNNVYCSFVEPERPPRTKYFSLQPDDPVELLIGKSGVAAVEPTTVGAFFKDSVERFPSTPALAFKGADGQWNGVTYTQYYNLCVRAAKSFLKVQNFIIISIISSTYTVNMVNLSCIYYKHVKACSN